MGTVNEKASGETCFFVVFYIKELIDYNGSILCVVKIKKAPQLRGAFQYKAC